MALAALALGALISVGYALWPDGSTKVSSPAPRSDGGETVASDLLMAPEEVQEAFRRDVHDYFELPPGEEREQFLDQIIAKIEDFHQGLPADMRDFPLDGPPAMGGPDGMPFGGPDGLGGPLDIDKGSTTEDQAKAQQFWADLQARRIARGLPEMPPPPFALH